MAGTISYTVTARKQLRKLDRPVAKRLMDFMDERVAAQADPRSTGAALTGPLLGAYWRYGLGITGSSATFRTGHSLSW